MPEGSPQDYANQLLSWFGNQQQQAVQDPGPMSPEPSVFGAPTHYAAMAHRGGLPIGQDWSPQTMDDLAGWPLFLSPQSLTSLQSAFRAALPYATTALGPLRRLASTAWPMIRPLLRSARKSDEGPESDDDPTEGLLRRVIAPMLYSPTFRPSLPGPVASLATYLALLAGGDTRPLTEEEQLERVRTIERVRGGRGGR